MSEITFSEDAELIYQGSAVVKNYGRSTKSGQYFSLSGLDQENFEQALTITSQKGNLPVNLIMGSGEELLIKNREFLLVQVLSSKRTEPTFKLQAEMLDNDLYEMTKTWAENETPMCITLYAGQFAAKSKKKSGEYKDFSRKLRMSPLLNDISFLSKVGSEKKYSEWLREQKCCLSGSFYKDLATGKEWCDPAHIRSVDNGAGMALKPPYMIVPLHHNLHEWSHHHSMTELWQLRHTERGNPINNHYRRMPKNIEYPIQSPSEIAKQFFNEKARQYQRQWVIYEITKWAGVPSLSWVSPEKFEQYKKHIKHED